MISMFRGGDAPLGGSLSEVPEAFRALAEQGMTQARENYEKLKSAAETGNASMEAAVDSATRGAGIYANRVMEITHANAESALNFSLTLMSITSLPDAIEFWSGQARSQIETFVAQANELTELGQRVASDAIEPIKAGASKAMDLVS